MDKQYFYTLGFLARTGRFEAIVPQKARRRFEDRYEEITGIRPQHGLDNYYLHANPNVNKWGPELRITFTAIPRELSELQFRSDKIRVVKSTKDGEYRINNNRFVWSLWKMGFRLGAQHDVAAIILKVPEQYRDLFKQGLGSQIITQEELDTEGRRHNREIAQRIGGEAEAHKRLKEFVAQNPSLLGLFPTGWGEQEYEFVAGDKCDVVFDLGELGMAVVEIKNGERGELVKGVYQAIKYRALMEAEKGRGTQFPVRAFLVAYTIPEEIALFAEQFDVECHIVQPP